MYLKLISGVLTTKNGSGHRILHYLDELEELQQKQYESDIVPGHQNEESSSCVSIL